MFAVVFCPLFRHQNQQNRTAHKTLNELAFRCLEMCSFPPTNKQKTKQQARFLSKEKLSSIFSFISRLCFIKCATDAVAASYNKEKNLQKQTAVKFLDSKEEKENLCSLVSRQPKTTYDKKLHFLVELFFFFLSSLSLPFSSFHFFLPLST